jgi:hypothetical protein
MIKRSGPDATPFLQALLDIGGLIVGGPAAAAGVRGAGAAAGAAALKSGRPDKKESSEPEMLKEILKYDPAPPTSFETIESFGPYTELEAIEPYDREIRPLKERKPKRRRKLTTGRLGGSEK